MTGKEYKITYSKEAKEYIDKQKIEKCLHDFQGFMPQDMVRVYHNQLNDFIVNKMSTSIKASVDVLVDEKKLEKWAKMCIRLENMSKEQIEDIAIRRYIEKLEKRQNDKLTKYKRAFEILKSKKIFEFKDDNCLYLNAEDHNWWGDIIESSFVRLSAEEYELLEELINDESR